MDLLALKRSLMPMSGPQDMGGGGGGGSTGTQTTVNELPEWARGYAKNTLEKATALSEKPYQAYEGPRIAGFSPMQLQSQQAAAGMTPNQATAAGIDVASTAALGGLNQNYQGGQFYGGQFTPGAAGAYMSPFIQQAMAPQLREAQRASDIMGQQNAAKAVGQGAFGGSRSALVEAERQRNLGIQQGDILSKGYQTAYEQAANQFNQDAARRMQAQQLGEQSRQFGANLGLQGLQTALQGAGQLGTLGGQQFQQGMDINKLQNAYGGQQQALRQQGLDTAYQDFLNQQNYPYKQLGFMSDMIRGLPLGQQSTQSMYQAPGSLAGQIGGLGVGALGLSKFMAEGGLAYADGGEVKTYAGDRGSVTSEENVAAIADKLDDKALQQAYQNALARRDVEAVKALEAELAMRASERGGMAGAFNQLPQQTQETFTAANGGIVAFADEGLVEQKESTYGEQMSNLGSFLAGLPIRAAKALTSYPDYMGKGVPQEKAAPAAKGESYDWSAFDKATDEYMAGRSKTADGKGQGTPATGLSGAVKQMAAQAGVPEEDFLTTFRKLRTELQAEGKEDMKALNDQIAKLGGRSQEIRDKGLGKALAEFGFNWAAAASKPGARFAGSAAQASPFLAASAAKTDELAAAAEDNAMKMRLTMKQYEIAQRKGDTQAAAQMAQNMRMLQQAEKQLELKRAEIAQSGGYQQGMLDIHRADLLRKEKADEARGLQAAAAQRAAEARMSDVRRRALLDFDTNNGRTLRKQLEEQYGPTKADYMYNQKRQAYVSDILQSARDQRADANTGVQSVYDLLSRE